MPRLPALRHRRLVAVVSAASACAALAGCSTPSSTPDDVASRNNSSAAAAEQAPATNTPVDAPTSDTDQTIVSDTIVCPADGPDLQPFTGPAVEAFGADNVMDAYCETAAFFVQRSVTSLTDPAATPRIEPATTARSLQFVTDRLTVAAAQRWHQSIVDASTAPGNDDALSQLTYFRLSLPEGLDFPAQGPASANPTVSEAFADVTRLDDSRKALTLWFTVTNTLPVRSKPSTNSTPAAQPSHAITLTRDVALTMLPNPDPHADPDTSWLIESWNNSYTASRPVQWASTR